MKGVPPYMQEICAQAAKRVGGYADLVRVAVYHRDPNEKVRVRIERDPETGKQCVVRLPSLK